MFVSASKLQSNNPCQVHSTIILTVRRLNCWQRISKARLSTNALIAISCPFRPCRQQRSIEGIFLFTCGHLLRKLKQENAFDSKLNVWEIVFFKIYKLNLLKLIDLIIDIKTNNKWLNKTYQYILSSTYQNGLQLLVKKRNKKASLKK